MFHRLIVNFGLSLSFLGFPCKKFLLLINFITLWENKGDLTNHCASMMIPQLEKGKFSNGEVVGKEFNSLMNLRMQWQCLSANPITHVVIERSSSARVPEALLAFQGCFQHYFKCSGASNSNLRGFRVYLYGSMWFLLILICVASIIW